MVLHNPGQPAPGFMCVIQEQCERLFAYEAAVYFLWLTWSWSCFYREKYFLKVEGQLCFMVHAPCLILAYSYQLGLKTLYEVSERLFGFSILAQGYMSSDATDAWFFHLQSVSETEFHFFMAVLQTINLE